MWDIGKAVIISIVLLTIALNTKEVDTCFLILGNDTAIDARVDVV